MAHAYWVCHECHGAPTVHGMEDWEEEAGVRGEKREGGRGREKEVAQEEGKGGGEGERKGKVWQEQRAAQDRRPRGPLILDSVNQWRGVKALVDQARMEGGQPMLEGGQPKGLGFRVKGL